MSVEEELRNDYIDDVAEAANLDTDQVSITSVEVLNPITGQYRITADIEFFDLDETSAQALITKLNDKTAFTRLNQKYGSIESVPNISTKKYIDTETKPKVITLKKASNGTVLEKLEVIRRRTGRVRERKINPADEADILETTEVSVADSNGHKIRNTIFKNQARRVIKFRANDESVIETTDVSAPDETTGDVTTKISQEDGSYVETVKDSSDTVKETTQVVIDESSGLITTTVTNDTTGEVNVDIDRLPMTLSLRNVVWTNLTDDAPTYEISIESSATNYRHVCRNSCAISSNGKRCVLIGSDSFARGGIMMKEYDETEDAWGIYNSDGTFVKDSYQHYKVFFTKGDIHWGQYPDSQFYSYFGSYCDMSADGNTIVTTGYSNTHTFVFEYDPITTKKWGKFVKDSFIEQTDSNHSFHSLSLRYHNLESEINPQDGYYDDCCISKNGKVVVASGYKDLVVVWFKDDTLIDKWYFKQSLGTTNSTRRSYSCVSRDGSTIFVGRDDKIVYVWKYENNSYVKKHTINTNKNIQAITTSADGTKFCTSSKTNGDIIVMEYNSETDRWGKFNADNTFSNSARHDLSIGTNSYDRIKCKMSADGKTLVTLGVRAMKTTGVSKAVTVWKYNDETKAWIKEKETFTNDEYLYVLYGFGFDLSYDGTTILTNAESRQQSNGDRSASFIWKGIDNGEASTLKVDQTTDLDTSFIAPPLPDSSTTITHRLIDWVDLDYSKTSPTYDILLSDAGNKPYGISSGVSSDGKRIVLSGYESDVSGGFIVYDYNSDQDAWGKYTTIGFEVNGYHEISRVTTAEDVNDIGQMGECVDMSADGKTIVVSGSLSISRTTGSAVVYEYDDVTKQWGKFVGAVGSSTFTPNEYHNLGSSFNNLSLDGQYGQKCNISLNGIVVVVSGSTTYPMTHRISVSVVSGQYQFTPAVTEFVPSHTYIFDNSVNASTHPLNFHDINSAADTYLYQQDANGIVTVADFSSQSALFAHCSHHANMGNTVNNTTSGIPVTLRNGAIVWFKDDAVVTDNRWNFKQALTKDDMFALDGYETDNSLSRDGSIIVVSNSVSSTAGDLHIWTYQNNNYVNTHSISKSGATGRFGSSCSISANGNTIVTSGYNDNTSGCAFVYEYNTDTSEWGKYNTDGTFSANVPHDLSLGVGATSFRYGTTCEISADGFSVLISGPRTHDATQGGGVVMWRQNTTTHVWSKMSDTETSTLGYSFGKNASLSASGNMVVMNGYATSTNGSVVHMWKGKDNGLSISDVQINQSTDIDTSYVLQIESRVSVRDVDWSGEVATSPSYTLVDAANTNAKYGKSAALSADGKRVILAGYQDDLVGGFLSWDFNESLDAWGKYGTTGFVSDSYHEISRTATSGEDVNNIGQMGEFCDISGDGNTVVISGSISNSTTNGFAAIYEYDGLSKQWGKYAGTSFIPNEYHNLSIAHNNISVENDMIKYGKKCNISLNGRVVVVSGDCAIVWFRDDRLKLAGKYYMKQQLSIDSMTNYGDSNALSRDGSVIIIGGSISATEGHLYVWKYQNNTYINTHSISKSGVTGQFGLSCSMSADGNTLVTSGYNNTTSGCAFVYEYDSATDAWGKYNSNGTFSNNVPHDLSITSGASFQYGENCEITADGKTVIVSGRNGTTGGGSVIWTYNDETKVWSNVKSTYSEQYGNTYGESSSISADGTLTIVGGHTELTGGPAVSLWRGVDNGERVNYSFVQSDDIDTLFSPILPDPNTTISARLVDFSGIDKNSPTYQLIEPNNNNTNPYGRHLAMSANGSVLVVSGYKHDLNGGAAVYEFNSELDQWGKFTTSGFESGGYHDFFRSTSWDNLNTVGELGQFCDISADGKTMILSGEVSNAYDKGLLYVYDYDDATKQWGKFEGETFTPNQYHDLSVLTNNITLANSLKYGERSAISMNGKVVVVSGSGSGGAYVWFRDSTSGWYLKQDLTLALSQYGYSCAVSRDGSTVLIGRSSSSAAGYVHVWKYQEGVYVNTHTIYKTSTPGRFGEAVSISADGNTFITSGYNNSEKGCAYVYQYNESTNQWGKFDSNGNFSNNNPHNLSITSGTPFTYGQKCKMSADGKSLFIVGRTGYSGNKGGGVLWMFNDTTKSWERLGNNLNDEYDYEYGEGGTLSADGTKIAISGRYQSSGGYKVNMWRGIDNGTSEEYLINQETDIDTTNPAAQGGGDGGDGAYSISVRDVDWSGASASSPAFDLTSSISSYTNGGRFGLRCTLSADGTRMVLVSPNVNNYHGFLTYDYNEGEWGHHTAEGFVSGSPALFERTFTSDDTANIGRYGQRCELSADGKTLILSGNTENTNGSLAIYDYDDATKQWGKFVGDTFTPNEHHNLNTAYNNLTVNGPYGRRCKISQNGQVVIVSGSHVETNGYFHCAIVWFKDPSTGWYVKQDLDTNFVEDASNFNWRLGLDCAISADGSRIAVTGGVSSIRIYVWNYDSASGTYVQNTDRIYKSVADNDMSFMDMSADGNTIVHSENNKKVHVFDYDSETNKWGKFNSDGSFTNVGYHDLSVTDVSYKYGRTCSISADGKTLIACGDYTHIFALSSSGGGALIWTYDDTTKTWVRGADLFTATQAGDFAEFCSLSADGTTILISGYLRMNNKNGPAAIVWKAVDNGELFVIDGSNDINTSN